MGMLPGVTAYTAQLGRRREAVAEALGRRCGAVLLGRHGGERWKWRLWGGDARPGGT